MPESKIRRALISVYDKTGIVEFARALHDDFGIKIISTGGTAKTLSEAGIPVTLVEDITGFPEMMGNLRITAYWNNTTSSIMYRYVGKQYLDNTENENRIVDPYSLVNLAVDYRLKDFFYFPEMRFMFTVNNLLDTEYETAGYYYYENYYSNGWYWKAYATTYTHSSKAIIKDCREINCRTFG